MERGYINLSMPESLYKEFRRVARSVFGDKKGYLSKAGSMAILNWVVTYEVFKEVYPDKSYDELQKVYYKTLEDFLKRHDKEDFSSQILSENLDLMEDQK